MTTDNLYKILGFWWQVLKVPYGHRGLYGPFCPNCYTDLEGDYKNSKLLVCTSCEKRFEIGYYDASFLEKEAFKRYKADLRSKLPKVSLEEPPTKVQVRDQDDKYFLASKIGQKDGKRVGVVYFGAKTKEQSKEDYSQIFIDLDDEQIRFDKSNKHPKNVVAKLKVEFPESTSEIASKKAS